VARAPSLEQSVEGGALRSRIAAVVVVAAAAAVVLALPALSAESQQAPKLTGTVGPGFTISMKKPKKAGKYTLVVVDRSSIHNFRLKGPGVNVATSVPATGTKTFKITLKKGKYTFVCDPHPTSMIGTFTIR
jgi:plastocyanin